VKVTATTKFGSMMVAGLLLWLLSLGGFRDVTGLMSRLRGGGPAISVVAPTRPDATEFFAAEKLRFKVNGADPTSVGWLFDETDYQRGNVETEFAFQYDETEPALVANHMVVAVFRHGDRYTAVEASVKVRNLRYDAAAHEDGSKIALAVPKTVGPEWRLRSVSLTSFQGGEYKTVSELLLAIEGQPDTVSAEIDPTTLDRAHNPQVAVAYGVPDRPTATLTLIRPLKALSSTTVLGDEPKQ